MSIEVISKVLCITQEEANVSVQKINDIWIDCYSKEAPPTPMRFLSVWNEHRKETEIFYQTAAFVEDKETGCLVKSWAVIGQLSLFNNHPCAVTYEIRQKGIQYWTFTFSKKDNEPVYVKMTHKAGGLSTNYHYFLRPRDDTGE